MKDMKMIDYFMPTEMDVKIIKENKDNLYIYFNIYHRHMFNKGTQFFYFKIIPTRELGEEFSDFRESISRTLEIVELIEYAYMSVEYDGNRDVYDHYQGIMAVRSLLGYNPNLGASIHERLQYCYRNMELKECRTIKEIDDSFNCVVKNHNYSNQTMFYNYSSHFNLIHGAMGDYLTSSSLHSFIEEYCCKNNKWKKIPHLIHDNELGKEVDPVDIIIFLYKLFLTLSQMCIYNGKIYKKDIKSRYTWTYAHDIDFLCKNYEKIITSLEYEFTIQLKRFDLKGLFARHIQTVIQKIKDYPNILINADIRHDAIEFLDGIYLIKHDCLIDFYEKYKGLDYDRLYVFKKYNIQYRSIRKPKKWLEYVSKNAGDKLEKLCFELGRYMQDTDNHDLLIGSENGKSTLIADILDNIKYPSKEYSKELVTYDSFKTCIIRNYSSIMFLYNLKTPIEEFKITHVLDYLLESLSTNKRKSLKKEIPSIFIYCNHIFYKRTKSNKKQAIKEFKELYMDDHYRGKIVKINGKIFHEKI